MREIIWAYCPSDRSKQGTTEEVADDMARQYVHEGLARYAREKPVEVEAEVASPEPVPAAARQEAAPAADAPSPTPDPAPKRPRVPAQSEAPKTS